MIAGKIDDEILSMNRWTRCRWYKTILPKEKEEAMKIVAVAGWAKIRASLTGKILSEETRAKISATQIGRILSEETCAKMSVAAIERMKDPELRAKISKTMTGKIRSKETKDKMSAAKIGVVFTEKHRAKLSASHMGKIASDETKAKISASKMGENHPNWQGGKSFEPYGLEFNEVLREQIRSRDNYICQECDITQEELGYRLDVHHIDYDKMNNRTENLISLCRSCHAKTGINREDWIKYFKEMMKRRGF